MSPDPLSWTLRFKKHKTTVLLMLPAQESIQSTKEKLHSALKARGLTQINGDPIPDDPSEIEFGAPIDRNELEKGWIRLDLPVDENGDSSTKKPGVGRPKKSSLTDSLQAADIHDGQAIALRLKKTADGEDDSATKKPGVGRPKKSSLTDSLQAADIRDGQAIAFRFRKTADGEDGDEDADLEDPGWDVLIPSLDDEEPE